MINTKNLVVGKLLFVTHYNGRNTKAIGLKPIEKIGRKYFYLTPYHKEEKFNINDGSNINEYSSHFTLFESEIAYNEAMEKRKAISKATKFIRNLSNKSLTYEEAALIISSFEIDIN